ncbi:cell division protein FtsA [Arcicella rigui]|uniref:Cell division protein FtsA n=1 Tax=Arcicella rigui TaxID=797020 RepID=A0ABU5Q7K5_9BACT|nr:cell division protein FtsA [Arcicella rigui]MEA5138815.1 cell division protein FtsA [Arcicella rigui]
MNEIIVGLDIGSKQVSVVAGRLDSLGKLEILGLGKADTTGRVSKGVVLNVNKTIEAVQSALEQVENQANIHIRGVIASIAGPNIHSSKHKAVITRQTRGEEVTVTDVDQVANDAQRTFISQGNAIVHTLPQEYLVDSASGIQEPVGISGLKLQGEFLMITSPQAELDKTKRCIERSKDKMEIEGGLVHSPLAASLAVLTDQEKKTGVALVDIGSGITEIVIYYKNIVRHVAVLPFAGDSITADIEQGCGVSTEHAEQLKIKFGSAVADEVSLEEVVTIPSANGRKPKTISVKNVSIIIEERLKELIALVVAEIARSGYLNRINCGIVITGGTAQMPYIDQLFERVSQRDVRIGYPNENLGKSFTEEIKNPTYSTAVGLVWRGIKDIDEREDGYKLLRKTAPAIIPITPVNNNNLSSKNGRESSKAAEPPVEKKGGWSLFGKFKQVASRMIGEDLGDNDKYEQ